MSNLHLVTGYAGVEHVTANDDASLHAAILGNGEFVLERGNQFAASILTNNQVRIDDGDLMMQGRHIRLKENTYIEVNFDKGSQGYKRNDLIVARYTKDSSTDVETAEFVVLKGTPTETDPADPEYTHGDILTEGALLNEMPLYRVPFDGLNMQPLEALFTVVSTMETQAIELRGKTEKAIEEMKETVVDNLDDVMAVTEDNVPVGCKAVSELNKKTEWTFVGSAIKLETVPIPSDAKELLVQVGIRATSNSAALQFTFNILNKNSETHLQGFYYDEKDNGSICIRTNMTDSTVGIYSGWTQIRSSNVSGIVLSVEDLNACVINLYYK